MCLRNGEPDQTDSMWKRYYCERVSSGNDAMNWPNPHNCNDHGSWKALSLLILTLSLAFKPKREEKILTSKATKPSFLVVLAQVWLVIPSHSGSEMVRSSHWALAHSSTCCIALGSIFLLKKLCVVVQPSVDFIISLTFGFLKEQK